MQSHSFSRREFLKFAGLASMGTALHACQRAAPFGTITPGPTYGKNTVILAIQSFAHEAMRPVLDAWTEKTGYKVQLVDGPASDFELVNRYLPAFASGTSPVDILSDGDSSVSDFYRAGYMEPLDDVIPQETWDDFPKLFKTQIDIFHSYHGRRYRVPHEFAVGYFWYRQDWFDDLGIDPPRTWDEFVRIGKEFTGNNVWGTLEALSPGLVFGYMAYFAAQAGGNIFNFDEATASAFQFVYDLIHTHRVFPEAGLEQDYTWQNGEYLGGRVAMMRQWPYFWGVSHENQAWTGKEDSEVNDRVAIALPPAGQAGAKSWWGGWGFTVPKAAPHKEAALDLLRWITNNENAPILAQRQSWFIMPRKSILDALGDEGLVPYMKMYIENNVPTARPFHERQADAQKIVDQIAREYLLKKLSLSAAMKQGAQQVKSLS